MLPNYWDILITSTKKKKEQEETGNISWQYNDKEMRFEAFFQNQNNKMCMQMWQLKDINTMKICDTIPVFESKTVVVT